MADGAAEGNYQIVLGSSLFDVDATMPDTGVFVTPTMMGGLIKVYNPIPEPASLVVFGMGAIALGFHAWRRRKIS